MELWILWALNSTSLLHVCCFNGAMNSTSQVMNTNLHVSYFIYMHVLRVLLNSIWKLRLEYLRAFYIILKMCFVFCENYMSYDAHFHIWSNLILFVINRVYFFYSFTQEISDKILKKSICIFWGGIYMDIYLLIKKHLKHWRLNFTLLLC